MKLANGRKRLVHIPTIKQPDFAMPCGGYSGDLNDNYSYGNSGYYVIEVPVNMDGKEVARITAPFTEEELNKKTDERKQKEGKTLMYDFRDTNAYLTNKPIPAEAMQINEVYLENEIDGYRTLYVKGRGAFS